jgi:hypothetical protein
VVDGFLGIQVQQCGYERLCWRTNPVAWVRRVVTVVDAPHLAQGEPKEDIHRFCSRGMVRIHLHWRLDYGNAAYSTALKLCSTDNIWRWDELFGLLCKRLGDFLCRARVDLKPSGPGVLAVDMPWPGTDTEVCAIPVLLMTPRHNKHLAGNMPDLKTAMREHWYRSWYGYAVQLNARSTLYVVLIHAVLRSRTQPPRRGRCVHPLSTVPDSHVACARSRTSAIVAETSFGSSSSLACAGVRVYCRMQ